MGTKNGFVEKFKKHKKKIVIATIITVGTGIVIHYLTGENQPVIDKIARKIGIGDEKDIDFDSTVGRFVDIWRENNSVKSIVTNLTPTDLGEFGNNLLKVDGIDSDTMIGLIVETM